MSAPELASSGAHRGSAETVVVSPGPRVVTARRRTPHRVRDSLAIRASALCCRGRRVGTWGSFAPRETCFRRNTRLDHGAQPTCNPPSPISASPLISSRPCTPAASTRPSPSRPSPSPTASPVATSAAAPRPARARRSPSASRSSRASRGAKPKRPRGLVLVPTRELAAQVLRRARVARARPPAPGRRRLRRRRLRRPAQGAAPRCRRRRRLPGPAHRPDRAQRVLASTRSRSSSSTKPTAWPTWASCPVVQRAARPDARRRARRCCSRPRSTAPSTRSCAATSATRCATSCPTSTSTSRAGHPPLLARRA